MQKRRPTGIGPSMARRRAYLQILALLATCRWDLAGGQLLAGQTAEEGASNCVGRAQHFRSVYVIDDTSLDRPTCAYSPALATTAGAPDT